MTELLQRSRQWLVYSDSVAAPYDRVLLTLMGVMLTIGLVIVASASVPLSNKLFGHPYHFMLRHGIYIALGTIAFFSVLRIPTQRWHDHSFGLLLAGVLLLVVVLIVGRSVNGSTRWIAIGPINIQPAELAKLFFFCYMASYLVRRHEEVRESFKGFLKPLFMLAVFASLLLIQPDLGTVIVMFVTVVGMLFLAGAGIYNFAALLSLGVSLIVGLAVTSEYRLRRITSFTNPWEDPFGAGYQLTQSLMAFGRGSWFGEGLGNSIQKMEYLPEAHTDFVVAILAEELGFVGVLLVIVVLTVIVYRSFVIGRRCLEQQQSFNGYMAYAIAIWFAFQGVVNIGAASGLLPTKGLTLPLISYGGSSLITTLIALGLLMRIDFERRQYQRETGEGDDE